LCVVYKKANLQKIVSSILVNLLYNFYIINKFLTEISIDNFVFLKRLKNNVTKKQVSRFTNNNQTKKK